jgi:signal transduction histidine kinase
MHNKRQVGMHLLPVLNAGFTLLILLLVASVYIGIEAMHSTESGAARLVEEQRATLRLIDDVQRDEDSLSAVFYALATGRGMKNNAAVLARLGALEGAIRRTIEAGLKSGDPKLWNDVKRAVEAFIAEGRSILRSGRTPSDTFYENHEALITALAALAGSNFDAAAAAQKREMEGSRQRVRYSLLLLGVALLTAVIAAGLTVRTVSQMFKRLEWQASELDHLSSRTMSDHEETARRFSRELHDEFGQTLSAIEANLVAMHNTRQYHATGMDDCLALVKNGIDNVRELSQLLRPSILDDFGLDASLRWLADAFSQRTGIKVEYQASGLDRLPGDTETQLFRISQEALTNVARHSGATLVRLRLTADKESLSLSISDNGKGFSAVGRTTGLGLVGMRARARTAGGTMKVESSAEHGVRIKVELPIARILNAT